MNEINESIKQMKQGWQTIDNRVSGLDYETKQRLEDVRDKCYSSNGVLSKGAEGGGKVCFFDKGITDEYNITCKHRGDYLREYNNGVHRANHYTCKCEAKK